VAVGQSVTKGDALVRMEALKMEMEVHADSEGTVAEIAVSPGQQVVAGAVLMTLA
jgi:biotin carboxyl carrier protein